MFFILVARANEPQETSTACPFSHYMCKEGLACNTWFLVGLSFPFVYARAPQEITTLNLYK